MTSAGEVLVLVPDVTSQPLVDSSLYALWSPSGRHLTAAALSGHVYLVDSSSGQVVDQKGRASPHYPRKPKAQIVARRQGSGVFTATLVIPSSLPSHSVVRL